MPPQLEKQSVNIVARGQFTPTIFHPTWFAAQGLVRQEEADAAEVEIIHPDVASLKMEWLRLHVMRDRLQAACAEEAFFDISRDLVTGIFELLSQTPVSALGINCGLHYQLESEKSWHALGDQLAPKQDWRQKLERPGLRSLVIEGKRPDNLPGYIQVKVEPWVAPHVQFGVYIEVNDHYDLSDFVKSAQSASRLVEILNSNWHSSTDRGIDIAQMVTRLGEEK